MSDLRDVLGAIPAASKNVIALIEFLFAVPVVSYFSYKIWSIRLITKLAPEAQLDALRMHFGEAPLRSKLGSRDWMRDRMMRYAVLVLLVLILVIGSIAILRLPPPPARGDEPVTQLLPPKQAAVPTAAVSFFSQPDKANLEIDGQWVGLTPTTATLGEGQHSVVFTKAGYKPHNDIISVPQQKTVSVVLEEK